MPRIITLTLNPAIDKCCTVDQVVSGRKLRCQEPTYHPGGGGLNVARAIAELGGQVTAYWTCGGPPGELLKRLLEKEGVNHFPIPVKATTRENLIVYESSGDQQYRFGMPGATLTNDEVQGSLDRLLELDPPPEYVVLSGSLPPGVEDSLYARITESVDPSCRVVLDTSGLPLQVGLRAPLYLVKPNMRELGQLAGAPIEDDSQIREVARSLIDAQRAQVVVTSLGSGGAVLTTADQHELVQAPTVRIRSKVGAGDSTIAGIVFALAQDRPLLESVRMGVAAGSAAVMTEGTQLCRREDVERLYQKISC
jgi:6-phosphofructokinase 2